MSKIIKLPSNKLLERGHPKFSHALLKFAQTSDGLALSLYVLEQLIGGIVVGKKGKIEEVQLDADAKISLSVIEEHFK
jgi:hypothetical protein